MLRLLLLVALALAVSYLVEEAVRRLRRELGATVGRERIRNAGPRSGVPAGGPAVELVACAVCGVHSPAARALYSSKTGFGKKGPFCSEACRQRAKAAS